MSDTALVIMAAGIGSRYGAGVKQLAEVGPSGEMIVDYSIHDALEAGFNKVIFITRRDLEDDFRELIGRRIERRCKVEYAFQEMEALPPGYSVPKGRTKPWGTGQAVLSCRTVVNDPFAVINADDYYGREAFVKVYDFLNSDECQPYHYCMAGYILKNTLSENGGVTRGICRADSGGRLLSITETSDIVRSPGGAKIEKSGMEVDADSLVSMNLWGLTPDFVELLDEGFSDFLGTLKEGDIKSEYLLPGLIGDLLDEGRISVKILKTQDRWFGVTYAADREAVRRELAALTEAGVYTTPLNR